MSDGNKPLESCSIKLKEHIISSEPFFIQAEYQLAEAMLEYLNTKGADKPDKQSWIKEVLTGGYDTMKSYFSNAQDGHKIKAFLRNCNKELYPSVALGLYQLLES